MERFIHYLRYSFFHPLATRLAPGGLLVDADTANREVRVWLETVANRRCHATTGAVPLVRLAEEHAHLQPLPPTWTGRLALTAAANAEAPLPSSQPLVSAPAQHPLAVYERLCRAEDLAS